MTDQPTLDLPLHDVGADTAAYTFTVSALAGDVYDGTLRDGRSARLPVTELPPGRSIAPGDVVFVSIMAPSQNPVVSAASPTLVASLYAGVSPEIRSGDVRVCAVARIPGVRSKIAVAATRDGLDPVAALIGRDANRVSYVSRLLGGERIDVIPYSTSIDQFATNAMAPAQVSSVRVEDARVVVVVPPHQMPAAVGGGGLNSLLAGELIGYPIEVVQG